MKTYGKVYCWRGELIELSDKNIGDLFWILEKGKEPMPKIMRCDLCEKSNNSEKRE